MIGPLSKTSSSKRDSNVTAAAAQWQHGLGRARVTVAATQDSAKKRLTQRKRLIRKRYADPLCGEA
jgi:hypothetical protein